MNDNYIAAEGTNVARGMFSSRKAPVATINSGDILRIETLNTGGIFDGFSAFADEQKLNRDDPFIKKLLYADSLPKPGGHNHLTTGPVYIRDAEPGDMLEVQILDVKLISDFSNLWMSPGEGGLPDLVKERKSMYIPFDEKREYATIGSCKVKLDPFFGIMATATPNDPLSVWPGNFGGNMDLKETKKGTSVYLPVFVPGALFYVGDGHAAQGDGEVALGALETCMEGEFKFILHKGKTIQMIRMENEQYYISMGVNASLDVACHDAIREAVYWIMELTGDSFEEALAIASTAVDFRVTQVVNDIKGVHSMIPKYLFKK